MDNKRKVGRPKLADTKLKKESIIVSSVCMLIAIILMTGGLVTLNILDFSKLKGSVINENEKVMNYCEVEKVSDSYIRITGDISQDYGRTGNALITLKSSDNTYTKEINVKTNSKTKFDIAVAKGDYTITVTKENYKAYQINVGESKNLSIKLRFDPMKRTYTQGSELCLADTECFYVISDDGTTIKAMAKYNLLVGNEVVWPNTDFDEPTSMDSIDSSTPGYGRQTSIAKAALIDNTTWTGTIAFADRVDDDTWWGYWVTKDENYNYNIKPEYGTEYPLWIFDSNSNLWQPVQNYQSYLQGKGYNSLTATLPSYEDMISLGCDPDEYSCLNAPSWTYETTYWLGSAGSDDGVWIVDSIGVFNYDSFDYDDYHYGIGVRPVITVLKSDL